MARCDDENAIILSYTTFAEDGTVTHAKDAAEIARILGGVFGTPYDKEMVRSRRKRLVRAGRCPSQVCDAPTPLGPTVDANALVSVPFMPGECCLIVNDLHIPHHDPQALAVMLAVARDVQPTQGILAGDALDWAGLSTFPNQPTTPSVSQEMRVARPILRDIRSVIRGRAEFKQGNHEWRYIRWILTQGKALGDLLRTLEEPEALDLGDWAVTGYHQDTELAGFRVTHGDAVRKGAGNSAQVEFEARLLSGISGHTHRAGSYRKTAAGREFAWYENGCLCRKDLSYVGAKGTDWQHAFAFLRHDGQSVQVEQVHIVAGRAYYGGKLYTSGS